MNNKNSDLKLQTRKYEIFIRTCGEKSLRICINAIKKQTSQPVHIIRNIKPVNKSFNCCINNATFPFFFIIDADVIVNQGSLDVLYYRMRKSSSGVAIIMPLLKDVFLNENIYAGFKIYRTQVVKNLQYQDDIDDDSFFNSYTLPKNNLKVIHLNDVLGFHGLYETNYSAYKRFRVRSAKYRLRSIRNKKEFGLHKPIIRLLERYSLLHDQRYLFAALGGLVGIMTSEPKTGAFSNTVFLDEYLQIMKMICRGK